MSKYTIHVTNESGDDFGCHDFDSKPSQQDLKEFLEKLSPGDWVAESRGPGVFGSYLHVDEV